MAERLPAPGARTFRASGDEYDRFMGRYSRELAPVFADFCRIDPGTTFLDVGCGPGALTEEAVRRLGPGAVHAIDPAPSFVEACRARCRGVDVRQGPAEHLPFEDREFDRAGAQLVLHFVSDADRAARELRRVVCAGGVVGACVWDFAAGMEMLRAYWDAALSLDPGAPDEARTLRYGKEGEIAALFGRAGLVDVAETTLTVRSAYAGFAELWDSFLLGVGPAGAHCVGLATPEREALREALFARLGRPARAFTLTAMARAARGTVPG